MKNCSIEEWLQFISRIVCLISLLTFPILLLLAVWQLCDSDLLMKITATNFTVLCIFGITFAVTRD